MAYSSPLSSVAFSLLLILVAFCSTAPRSAVVSGLSIREATVHDLQLAFEQNQLTSRGLVEFYIGEVHRLNPVVHGVIEINPDALLQAEKADREREAKKPGSLCGLHGIPVLLKDNIGTKDKLNTTAGSFALLGSVVPRDAGVVKRLRRAGAIILGKASLSEWADFRSLIAPAGLSARGGQGKELLNVFGQEIFLAAEATNGIGDLQTAALLSLAKLTEDGFEKLVTKKQLDAVVTAGPGIAPVLAIGGFPGINVPAGYDSEGVPFGINFGGLKGSEAKLIEIAYGFEQATLIRKPPSFKP